MEAVAIGLALSMFSAIDDPRASNARHRLVDVFAIVLLSMMSGSDDYPESLRQLEISAFRRHGDF